MYAEEPTVALRTTLVDYWGRNHSESNPVPTKVTHAVDVAGANLTAALMQIKMLNLPIDQYLVSNDGFFVTTNDGTILKAD